MSKTRERLEDRLAFHVRVTLACGDEGEERSASHDVALQLLSIAAIELARLRAKGDDGQERGTTPVKSVDGAAERPKTDKHRHVFDEHGVCHVPIASGLCEKTKAANGRKPAGAAPPETQGGGSSS